MTEQEIEKLANEQLGGGYTNYDLVKTSWIAGVRYILSNPDYILIEKEYITDQLKELKQEYKTDKDFAWGNEIKAKIEVLKDILSNSKTK